MPVNDEAPDGAETSRAYEPCLEAAYAFLDAFENGDWERFRNCFAEDATVFFLPSAHFPRRAEGRAEIEAVFPRVFAAARQKESVAPYLTIEPKDIRLHQLHRAGVVTFHLEDPDAFGRRTIVFEKREETWLIVHLHASNLSGNHV